jgi:hypothetical protein
MLTMTTETGVMQEMLVRDNEFVSDREAMGSFVYGEYSDSNLGGQNPISAYVNNAERIDMSNMTAYDEGCDEAFQMAMINYIEGTHSFEEALEFFYWRIAEQYPELGR